MHSSVTIASLLCFLPVTKLFSIVTLSIVPVVYIESPIITQLRWDTSSKNIVITMVLRIE